MSVVMVRVYYYVRSHPHQLAFGDPIIAYNESYRQERIDIAGSYWIQPDITEVIERVCALLEQQGRSDLAGLVNPQNLVPTLR